MILFELMEEVMSTFFIMVYIAAMTLILHKLKSFLTDGTTAQREIECATQSAHRYPLYSC